MIVGDMEIRLRADIARLQRDMDSARQTVSTATAGMARAADAAKSALAGIGLGLGLAQIAQMSDQYTKFTAQLRLATLSAREYSQALASVKAISTAAQSGMAEMGTLYARIANGTRELGTTQKQVANITETVGLALKVSGATAQESSSAMLQLSQSFASGTLRGEEFNAVNEAAPRLMLALADGIGVPVGALKKMAGEGLITSQIMADVLPKALGKLREEAKQIQTISGAFQVLKDRVMELTAVHAQENGAVAGLTQGIGLLANNLSGLLTIMTGLTIIKGATWAAEWVAATRARIVANQALLASAVESAAAEARRAAADRQSALIAQSRAREAVAAARVEVAADQQRMASAAAASEAAIAARVAQFAETRAIVLAEIELEKVRFAAQINSIGRAARVAEMGRLSTQVAAINAGMAASSTELAAVRIANENAAAAAAAAGAAKIAAAREAEVLATGGAAAATLRMRLATAALTTAMGAASLASRVLTGALALLGGPIGAVITLLTLGGLAWMTWGKSAKEGSDTASAAVEESGKEMIARLDKQIEKLKERNALAETEPRIKSLTDLNDADRDNLARQKARLEANKAGTGEFAGQSATIRQLNEIDLLHTYETALARVGQAQDEATRAANRGRDAKVAAWYADNGTAAQKMAAELAKLKKEFGEIPPEMEKLVRAKYADKGAATQIKQEETAYKSLMTSIQQKIAANALERDGYESMSDAQKMTIKLDAEILTGKNKLTKGDIERARAQIAVVASEDQAIARSKAMAQIQAEYAANIGKSVEEANKEAAANEDLVKTFGMTRTAIANLEVARIEERLERLRAIDMADDEVAALEMVIAAKKRSAAAFGSVEALEANKKATDQQTEDQKAMWESIDKTAHDTFVSIFDSGKSAFDRLRDTLKNGLLDLLYQMTIKKWILNIGASVGMGGAGGLAQAADAVTGGTGVASSNGLIGMAQAASGIYKAITGGFSTLSTTVADTVQAGMYGTGMTDQILTNSAFANSVGSATASAAGAVAGHYIGNAIAGDYSVAHGQTVTNVASVIGAVVGGPIGGAIGGAIGGLINRAFGMGSTQMQAQGISGSISSGGVTGGSYQNLHQDGGWFRSDKNWTETKAFSADMVTQFTQGFAAIKGASAGFATALGASVDSIASYSKDFNIKLTSDAEANKKAVSDFFVGVGDEIALRLVPNLREFSKSGETMSTTLERLAGDFQATNQVAMLMGVSGKAMFGSLGIESAAARERLIELAGGVSNLGAQANTFAQNYLTEAERLAPVSEAVAAAMASLGMASVTTREQFKLVVQSLDVTTAAGAQQFASMMALADSFAQVHPLVEATTAAMRTEADVLSERKDLMKQIDQATLTSAQLRAKERLAIDASNLALFDQITQLQTIASTSDALKTSIDKLKTFKDGILSFRDSLTLGSLSTLNPMQKAAEAQRQYEDMLAKARAGDATAQAGIQGAATAYLTADQIVKASSDAYVNDAMKVQADLMALADAAGAQISVDQLQLTALDNQVSQMVTLNTTVEGLRDDNAKLREDNAKLISAVQEQTAVLATVMLKSADTNAAAIGSSMQRAAAIKNYQQNLDAEATPQ